LIINKTGKISEDLYMLGAPGIPVFLLDGPDPVVFDAGFSFLGKKYVKDIKNILGDRTPAYCFLTHAHYDHCGSVSVLRNAFPRMKIVSSHKAKDILTRPNAIKLITKLSLNAEQAGNRGKEDKYPAADPFQPFGIDMCVKDGDTVELSGGISIRAIETPGHTRDHLSFYIPERKILMASEAAGSVDNTGYITTECLVDYDLYFSSLLKLTGLDVEIICLAHNYVYTGEDAQKFLRESMAQSEAFRELAEGTLTEENGNLEKVIGRIKKIEYDSLEGHKQSSSAYLINLEARIKAVQKRMEKGVS